MADESQTTSLQSDASAPSEVLDQFRKPNSPPVITTGDMSNYNYGLTPDQEAAYNAQQAQFDPATGPLSADTYYPGLHHNVAVGQYSGSEIGSATLFAPGGALVPIGMMDARDAAIKRSALQKAKDIDDWKKKNSVAPTSKLTNINDNIRQEYFKHQDASWNKALKAAGGDGNKAKYILENDPEYQAKNKSFYDQAKMGDAVVAQDAQLEDDVRSGKKVLTPAMVEARKRLHASTNPGSDEFKNFANAYNSYVAVDEFNNAYNTVMDKMTKEKLASAGISDSDPQYWTEYKKTKEQLTPEQKQAVEQSLNQMYSGGRGMDMYTPDFIHKQVWGRNSDVREEKSVNLQVKPSDKGEGDTYDDSSSVVAQSEENHSSPEGKIHSTVSEHLVPAGASDQTKKIKVALSGSDFSATKDQPIKQAGNVEGTVQGWAAKLYDKDKKRYLNPDEAKTVEKMMADGTARQKHSYEWRAVALFNVVPKTVGGKQQNAGADTPQETIIMDADKFAGVFKGKTKKSQGHDFDEMREKTVEYAKQKNESMKQPEEKDSGGVFYTIHGKQHPKSAVEKAAKASGMTVDEYLIEVTK